MPRPNAVDAAAKWSRNLGAAGDNIRKGVNAVTVSPGKLAAEQVDRYVNGVQASSKKWQKKLEKMTLEDWKKAVIEKGLGRIANGANAAKPKYEAFYREFEQHLNNLDNVLKGMPRGGLQQNIQRMVKAVELASQWGTDRRDR
jgi:hypothetical protein